MNESTCAGKLVITHHVLDSELPCSTFFVETRETLIYALIGKMRVYANSAFLGTIGGRTVVTDPLAHVIRFPAGHPQTVTLVLEGFAADCLVVACDAEENTQTTLPYLHWNDTFWHTVGCGTHQRTVGEVPTPPSFHISCGETLNVPGGTSSYPPHATDDDLRVFAEGKTTWEEQFYVVCPAPARAILKGLYARDEPVEKTILLKNGDIVRMPLGSHPVTAAAGAWCYYFWAFCGSALQKKYNRFSTDTGTYVK